MVKIKIDRLLTMADNKGSWPYSTAAASLTMPHPESVLNILLRTKYTQPLHPQSLRRAPSTHTYIREKPKEVKNTIATSTFYGVFPI
jgi:hypothetical protein